MNGLRDAWVSGYTFPSTPTVNASGGPGGSRPTLGGDLGFNVGHETFRVQLAISGLILAAFVGFLLLHRAGHRFSVHVQ